MEWSLPLLEASQFDLLTPVLVNEAPLSQLWDPPVCPGAGTVQMERMCLVGAEFTLLKPEIQGTFRERNTEVGNSQHLQPARGTHHGSQVRNSCF